MRNKIEKMGPKKSEVIARQKDNVTVMKWRDKRDVAMISTCHGANMSSEYRPMMKPEAVIYYNERKKGIDVLYLTSLQVIMTLKESRLHGTKRSV